MRIPRDVFQYAEALRRVRALEQERASQTDDMPSVDPGPAIRAEVDRFQAREIEYRDLSREAAMHVTLESIKAQREDPFFYSDLPTLLEMETWAPLHAMLILAGVDPSAPIMDWSYENFMGAQIDQPKIRHANWFSYGGDLYDYPVSSDFEYSSAELKRLQRTAENGSTPEERAELAKRLRQVEKWETDETSKFKSAVLQLRSSMLGILKSRWDSCDHDPEARRSPAYFVRWAESRGFEVEWAAWAREHDFIDQEPPVTAAPFFDADAEDYPKLLHIAVRAWEHARSGGKGTAKQRIAAFLDERYPELSGSEREMIAVVGNWQKSGGRPRTGG